MKNEIITKKDPKFKKLSDLVHLFGLLRNKKTCIWTLDSLGKKQDMITGNSFMDLYHINRESSCWQVFIYTEKKVI